MAENYNLSVAASALNTAITKANAAAPQSTTYTKTEVDAAIAAETSARQSADATLTSALANVIDTGAKNLLKITGTSQTIRNVTFTVNDDGTVTVDGTNNTSSTAVFYLNILPADTAPNYNGCRLTGCPQGGSTSTYRLAVQLNSGSYTTYASDTGNGATIRNVPSSDCRVGIFIYPGATVDNLIFKPMICTVEDYAISSEYVPYALSNRELYEEVKNIENSMQVSQFNTTAFSSLAAYVDTLSNGTYSFLIPNNNSLTDVPAAINNSNTIVTVKIYNTNSMVIEAVALSTTYQQYRYSKIKSAGVWRDWYRFEGQQ